MLFLSFFFLQNNHGVIFLYTHLSLFKYLEVWFNKIAICFFCMWSVWVATPEKKVEIFSKARCNGSKKNKQVIGPFFSLGFNHIRTFYSGTLVFDLLALSTSRLIGSWLLCHFYSAAAPCHTVLISPDQNPRPNQDDRSLLALSPSIKHFVVPAGENATFEAVNFIPLSQFFCYTWFYFPGCNI